MNVLINGCSFMHNWHYARQFSELLQAGAVNLAIQGSSNRRIIRTTVDYIESNTVDIAIIGLTFYDRQESPFKINLSDPWVSYNSQGMQAVFSDPSDFSSFAEHQAIGRYIQDRYRYDINQHYIDILILDLRMLAGYLRERGIKFCIFNTCDRHLPILDLGPGFIPFDFIGNVFLEQNGAQCYEPDRDLPQNARHHYGEDVKILTQYLCEHVQ